jgi:hypothetical protein
MSAPLPLNCPKCPRRMAYLQTLETGVLVYVCDVHGEWHLGPGGLYPPFNPPFPGSKPPDHSPDSGSV